MKRTLRSIDEMTGAGIAVDGDRRTLERVARRYAIAITSDMAELIEPAAADDPIRRQFVPDVRELDMQPDERTDPIGDRVHEKSDGLIHRYPDRVLLKVTHACPVYCRFCFRREVVGPGGEPPMTGAVLDEAISYIAADPRIFEVILTGGDPLILAPRRIEELTRRLSAIPHVAVLRWHSRVPVVDPERISDEMIRALKAGSKTVYVGIHANHPRELTPAARAAIARLADAGIGLLSQTVLLKGVNNSPAVLEELFRAFVTLRVRPYYLHHADFAPGTAHFRTTIAEGQAIMRQLRGRVTGLALPTYILDIPGGFGKVPVGPHYVDDDGTVVADPNGQIHVYPPNAG